MKKYIYVIAGFLLVLALSLLDNSCTTTKKATDKSGAELWGQNCGRCHNAPGPGEFRNSNWDIVAQHMRVRANITGTDSDKIIAFLKTK